MTATIYANEQFPRATVEALRELGLDVRTTHEERQSNRGIPDLDVVAYAAARGWIVLTQNRRDFSVIHRDLDGDHSGIVLCTVDPDYSRLARRIKAKLDEFSSFEGQLIRVVRGDGVR